MGFKLPGKSMTSGTSSHSSALKMKASPAKIIPLLASAPVAIAAGSKLAYDYFKKPSTSEGTDSTKPNKNTNKNTKKNTKKKTDYKAMQAKSAKNDPRYGKMSAADYKTEVLRQSASKKAGKGFDAMGVYDSKGKKKTTKVDKPVTVDKTVTVENKPVEKKKGTKLGNFLSRITKKATPETKAKRKEAASKRRSGESQFQANVRTRKAKRASNKADAAYYGSTEDTAKNSEANKVKSTPAKMVKKSSMKMKKAPAKFNAELKKASADGKLSGEFKKAVDKSPVEMKKAAMKMKKQSMAKMMKKKK